MDQILGEEIEQAQVVYDALVQFFVNYSMQVIGAIIILIVGYFVARAVSSWLTRFLKDKSLDVTLSELLGSITFFAILFCFIVISLGKFGISVAPFVAALGAFTLGAGLAIQGVVGNYGAGFSIIFNRPFVVGNTLTVQGVSGVVERITLPYTFLKTEDGEQITIPNKEIIGQILENSFEYKLVESLVHVESDIQLDAFETALRAALETSGQVAKDPAPQIGIDEFAERALVLGVRVWVPTAMYYQARYTVNRMIVDVLAQTGNQLATPRRHIQMAS